MTADVVANAGALRERCETALADWLDRQRPDWPDPAVFDMMRRFVLHGGKRLRPMFCYWGWRGAGGDDGPEIVSAAAALELFHAFALIHDDIMDGSDLRRGEPSVHRRLADEHHRRGWRGSSGAYGAGAALLVGDLLAAWADELFAVADRDRRGAALFARMRTEVIAGQYLDLRAGAGAGTVADALTVVRMKAARYTVTRPLQIGAALAGAGDDLLAAYRAFGDPLGDAFQLRDDILGVFGDPAITGKPALDDLREGKQTVMLALARDHATPAQAAQLDRLVGDPLLDEPAAATLRQILIDTGALTRTERMIHIRAEAAHAALAAAPITPESAAALTELATRTIHRLS
ncbi:geranylgeranyl diphosphate synthase type I [Catenuloplanes nepalensis]|uniref:Geranylgeranyl diphosphate synthase type I n=1 Tax=Catenuloplanes nepalensis TaxID=587533 RepID=A0ABT9MTE2_9ACTN|nr:polyprenyl synthetase family protein [Catenuloplanes nepalensis]MDP9794693.1 geranylgeranyl diphosphate synthase type I [Catenuloplanes nepalensis]